MWIEATTPVTVKFPTGDIRLTPGVPVEIPTAQAQRLLVKAEGKVREAKRDWLASWRELAQATHGIMPDDYRFIPVLAGLTQCDHAFIADDWPAFKRAAVEVMQIVERR